MGNFSWLSAIVGFMVAILFEEVFIRSGKHPVSVQIDPSVLKSIPKDPELELLLEVEYFRNQSLVQQHALRESKRDHETLVQQLSDLERDFHSSIAPQVAHAASMGAGLTKKTLTPECALNVRLARERFCSCEMDPCPMFYSGYDCKKGIEEVPSCLAPWSVPFNQSDTFPFTLSQDSIRKKYRESVPVVDFGIFPPREGSHKVERMTLAISDDVMKLLPTKEVISSKLYRSCALVGNSQDLMNQNYSKIIDNHDIIVRLNGAIVKGYEDHVGSRTHLRFVTSQWIGFREQATEKIVHLDKESEDPLYGCDMETECTHASKTMERYVQSLMLKKKVHTHTIHPSVAKWLRTKDNRTYAGQEMEIMGSTGFQAMVLMLHVCEKVDLFGFSGSTAQKYFDDSRALEKQKDLLIRWKQELYEKNNDKYYHGKNSRRLLSTSHLEGSDNPASLDLDWRAEVEGVTTSSDVSETRRQLQRRHHKKKAPPPPPPPKKKKKKIEAEELDADNSIPESIANGMITGFLVDLDYERKCQQDLVNKGILTVYGAHVDMSFIETEHKEIQNALASRLDTQAENMVTDATGGSAETETGTETETLDIDTSEEG